MIERCVSELKVLDSRSRSFWGDEEDGEVSFLLPRVFSPGSKLRENALAARALLECLTEIDVLYWRIRGGCNPLTRAVIEPLYVNPLYYKRTSIWDTTPALYARGYGDCKSLACTRAAEYRLAGRQSRPFFRYVPPELNPEKEYMYHIVTGKDQPSNFSPPVPFEEVGKTFEDPSKIKGMGQDEWAYFEQKNSPNQIIQSTAKTLRAAGDFVSSFFR